MGPDYDKELEIFKTMLDQMTEKEMFEKYSQVQEKHDDYEEDENFKPDYELANSDALVEVGKVIKLIGPGEDIVEGLVVERQEDNYIAVIYDETSEQEKRIKFHKELSTETP